MDLFPFPYFSFITATAEILCLLSHSSLDAARMLVACQKAGFNQADAEIKQPTTADGHKAKEGHCSVSEELDGGGTTKESLSASDEVTLRLQRCLELFEATKQNLARVCVLLEDVIKVDTHERICLRSYVKAPEMQTIRRPR